MACLSWAESTDLAPEIAIGVAGKEWVLLAETEKTLLSENCLDIEGLSFCPSEDCVPGMRRIVLSPSKIDGFFVFRLFCGSRFLMDDFDLEELGRGGKPADPARAELGNAFSKDLAGISKEERFGGRLEWCAVTISPSLLLRSSDAYNVEICVYILVLLSWVIYSGTFLYIIMRLILLILGELEDSIHLFPVYKAL